MKEFNLELRYYVIKIKDLVALSSEEVYLLDEILDRLSTYRCLNGTSEIDAIVGESHWKCYPTVLELVKQEYLNENTTK